jgi:phosphopantetheinyl transferase (holo-ACP synthase)
MIGNDVVDLGDPESRAEGRHPRFDGRVFDGTERALIEASPQRERTRWLLWAAKESAYKAARKEDPRTVFVPSRFVVWLEGHPRVTVAVSDRRFHVDLVASADHVHAVARAAGDSRRDICTAVAKLPELVTGNEAVRWLAIATLSRLLGVPPGDLAIRREGRIPTLYLRGRRSPADLTLSHHGRFVAFACKLP